MMKKLNPLYRITSIIAIVILAGGLLFSANAEDKKGKCKMGCEPGKMEKGIVTGTNFCPGCELKRDLGATSACKTYGHKNALKVSKFVDACGNEKTEFNGRTLFFLENDKSTELVNGHHGETLEVTGKIYIEIPMIEVESYKTVN